jgi:hypothetical protein
MQPSASSRGIDSTDSSGGDEEIQIQSVRFEPASPIVGQTIKARVKTSAAGNSQVRFDFEWTVGGMRMSERGPQIPLRSGRRGVSIEVIVVARNNHGTSAPFIASTTVGNSPPSIREITIEPAGHITANSEATAHPIDPTDADGDALDFRYSWRLNGSLADVQGPAFSTEGLHRGDRLQVQVVAFDGEDDSEPLASREITIANSAPVIVSQPGGADADGVFRYRVKAEDPDGNTGFRYRLAKAPEGMTITSGYGWIEWKPRRDQGGTHTVEVLVEDADGGQGGQRFEVAVDTSDPATEPAAPPASASIDPASPEN